MRKKKMLHNVSRHLPPLNFITIHYTYFVFMIILTSVIFYSSSDPKWSIGYTDSLFLVVSAITEAGLNTVNLSQMTTLQQFILWFNIIIGSSIFISIFTVLARKNAFERNFKQIVKDQRADRMHCHRRSHPDVTGSTEHTTIGKNTASERPEQFVDFDRGQSVPRDLQTETCPPGEGKEPNLEFGVAEDVIDDSHTKSGFYEVKEFSTNRDESCQQQDHNKDHMSFSLGQEHSWEPNFIREVPHTDSTGVHRPNMDGVSNRRPENKEYKSEEPVLHWAQYPSYLTRYTTGRNGQFYNLTKAEREHLGGVEYRAISLLAWIVSMYFVLWQLLGCIGLAAYMAHNRAETTMNNGVNPWWLGIFNGASAFNNSGMSLLDANMIPFQTSTYPLMTMGLMILAGNTAYPIFLRLIIWSMLKILTLIHPSPAAYTDWKATLLFILRYPRRLYTNLFPSVPTWWLLFMIISLNCTDWAAFEILSIGNSAIATIPPHFRVLDGLFQALAVRSGGFYVVNIATLRIGLQVLYVIMMYISAYPVVITMRHSNVYEERSLGIYSSVDGSYDDERSPSPNSGQIQTQTPKLGILGKLRRTLTKAIALHGGDAAVPQQPGALTTGREFVRMQLRSQLSHDLWWLALAIFLITCVEGSHFERDPATYSVFNIIFEVVSGYGCVGITVGLPNESYSFSGAWHKVSKLILCAVMLRGRHRGLPVALDMAVQLPSSAGAMNGAQEEEDCTNRSIGRRMSMVGSRGGAAGVPGGSENI